jgi:hypothetical protein
MEDLVRRSQRRRNKGGLKVMSGERWAQSGYQTVGESRLEPSNTYQVQPAMKSRLVPRVPDRYMAARKAIRLPEGDSATGLSPADRTVPKLTIRSISPTEPPDPGKAL